MLQVCKAVCHQDARGLVGLYTDAPRMAPYLMDHMLERLRKHCAAVMHAYSGPIPLSAAATFLCFDTRKEVRLPCQQSASASAVGCLSVAEVQQSFNRIHGHILAACYGTVYACTRHCATAPFKVRSAG